MSLPPWCTETNCLLGCFSVMPNRVQGLFPYHQPLPCVLHSWHWHQKDYWFCPLGYTTNLRSCPADVVWGLQPQTSSLSTWPHPWSAPADVIITVYSIFSFTMALAFPFLLFFLFSSFYGGVISENRRGQKDLCYLKTKSLLLTPFLTTFDMEHVGGFSQV